MLCKDFFVKKSVNFVFILFTKATLMFIISAFGDDNMASNTKKIEMCSGPLFKNIIRFTVPFMLTAFLQHLYNAADVIVVGRYAGEEALAGVGTTSSLTTLILNMFLGLSVGVSVSLGRALGANNNDEVHKIVHTAIPLSIISGAVVSVIGIFLPNHFLILLTCPTMLCLRQKSICRLFLPEKFRL